MKLRGRQSKMPVELTENMTAAQEETTDWQEMVQNDWTLETMETSLKELNPGAATMRNFVLS
jgi:hypothetical protein